MKESSQEQGHILIGLSILFSIGTVALSIIFALVAISHENFLASGVCLIPASISSGVLLNSLTRH